MFKFLIVSMLILGQAWAGNGSHGGDGLIINGKPYLLDLVEAGVEDAPFYNPNVEINPTIQSVLNRSLPNFAVASKKLAKKISEIHAVSPHIAYAITYAFDFYDFRLVSPSLVNIPDEDSVIDYDPKMLVQLAIRKGAVILIDRVNWSKLDSDHQAALLLHEMIYALAEVEMINKFVGYDVQGNPLFIETKGQLSSPARGLVGFLYSEGFIKGTYGSRLVTSLYGSQLLALLNLNNAPKTAIKTARGYVFANDQRYYDDFMGHLVVVEKNKTDAEIVSYCNTINNHIFYNDFTLVEDHFSLEFLPSVGGLDIKDYSPEIRSLAAKTPSECLASYKHIQSLIPVGESLN